MIPSSVIWQKYAINGYNVDDILEGRRGHRRTRNFALIPLSVDELSSLLSTGAPTASQYSTYWGRTTKEQYAKWNEAALVMLLGTLFSYCLSFVFGSFIATLLGVVCFFWAILGPELKATQRNWELLGGRNLVDPWTVTGREDQQGLYGALFLGRVADIAVVEDAESRIEYDLADFSDYSMEYDALEQLTGVPYLLRVRLEDREGRTLQVHARLSEEYLDLEENQAVAGVLMSTSQKFTSLAAMTDMLVPDAQCWIGDYPYLDRAELERFLVETDALWDALQMEPANGSGRDALGGSYGDVVGGDTVNGGIEKVPARRQRK